MPPPLVHIGYHKTGTTWLQRRLFVPEHGYRPLMTHEEVWAELVAPHDLVFDPAAARDALEARRAAPAGPGMADVISSELLSGNPFYGGRESAAMARRLHAVVPQARILITIREQIAAAASIYMQYILRGGTERPERFFAGAPSLGYPAFSPGHLKYHRLIGLYRDLFGPGNVHVFTQEGFIADMAGTLGALAAFAGNGPFAERPPPDPSPVGVSNAEITAGVLRRINHFRDGPAGRGPVLDLGRAGDFLFRAAGRAGRHPALGKIARRRPVTGFVRRRFAGEFAASNRALHRMLGEQVDLSRYEMADAV
ncbi:MAG: hypothetical protein ACE5FS_03960 [Paracoccaceae bacterium]